MSKITLFGIYNYLRLDGDDLFKNLAVNEYIDRDTLIDDIIDKGGEFEVIYANPHYLQHKVDIWSKKWQRTIDKWCEALQIKYDPLNNYDRIEEVTTTDNSRGTSHDESHSTGSGDTTNTVSAYNVSDFSNDSKDATTSQADTSSDTTMINSNTNVRNARISGNIGTTTSQMMLESELSVAMWNLIDHISDMFIAEFCIQVY